MKVNIHELAVKEFDESITWYDNQSRGLGERFKKSVINLIKKIKKNPACLLIESEPIHQAYIPKFPYKIVFISETNSITI